MRRSKVRRVRKLVGLSRRESLEKHPWSELRLGFESLLAFAPNVGKGIDVSLIAARFLSQWPATHFAYPCPVPSNTLLFCLPGICQGHSLFDNAEFG